MDTTFKVAVATTIAREVVKSIERSLEVIEEKAKEQKLYRC